MDDVFIFKATDYMDNGIDLTDIGQKLVAEALTFGSSLDETCDVYKLDNCGNDLSDTSRTARPAFYPAR